MKAFKNPTMRYAISLAASWAWGVSLVVGMQTVQEKGMIPFWIWAIANSLALPMFGFIAYRIPNFERVIHNKIVQLFMTGIMVFCLWIQMNAIRQILGSTGLFGDTMCKAIPIVLALLLTAGLYTDGLVRNILLDNPLWIGCYILLIVIMVYGFVTGQPRYEIVAVQAPEEINWALNSTLILFAGPIMNIQNWQMAEKLHKEKAMNAHLLAGIIFGIYMLFVYILSFLKFDTFMNILLVPVILCITLTTADAAIVGMQRIGGRNIGTVLSLLAIIFWKNLQDIGVLELWTIMGNARLHVAVICIIVALLITVIEKKKTKEVR